MRCNVFNTFAATIWKGLPQQREPITMGHADISAKHNQSRHGVETRQNFKAFIMSCNFMLSWLHCAQIF